MAADPDPGSPEPRPARSARSEASRQRILDAAAACFVDFGYARTRLDDVARRAGVSRALVYNHFGGKEALLERVRDRALTGWRTAVAPEIERAPDASGQLRAMLRHTLMYARSRPLLQAILTDDVRIVVLGAAADARQPIAEWRSQLAGILRRGVAEGSFRADLDVEHTADALRAMQLGIVDRMHRRDGPIDVSDEAHVEAAVELMTRGVLALARG